ncbi:MAG: hypothetical protein WA667_25175, partial [Candidatus Nitrosopolaris sp.]
ATSLPIHQEVYHYEVYLSNPVCLHCYIFSATCIRLQGDHNNNKMERMNGEVRDPEKVIRGSKRTDTAVLTGYQLYHNYFRPHEALNGKTPAEKCGIVIEGQNKWKTVIENASKRGSEA